MQDANQQVFRLCHFMPFYWWKLHHFCPCVGAGSHPPICHPPGHSHPTPPQPKISPEQHLPQTTSSLCTSSPASPPLLPRKTGLQELRTAVQGLGLIFCQNPSSWAFMHLPVRNAFDQQLMTSCLTLPASIPCCWGFVAAASGRVVHVHARGKGRQAVPAHPPPPRLAPKPRFKKVCSTKEVHF